MRLGPSVKIVALILLAVEGSGKDVSFIQVNKAVLYQQSSPSAPAMQPNPYQFRARVDLTRAQGASSATVKWPPPGNVTRSLSNSVTYWEFSQRFSSQQSMNIAHPNGAYSIITQTAADGQRTNVVTLSADFYPNVVRVANFAAAQAIRASDNFVLQWDPVGMSAADMIQVRIFSNEELIFESGSVPGAAGTLNGQATSVSIPKNTLEDGAVYRAEVIAHKRSTADTAGYPGVTAWAMYSRLTEFPLHTIYPTVDVHWYGLAKLKRFAQSSVLPPQPPPNGRYDFRAFAAATDVQNLKGAAVRLPNGSTRSLAAAGASWSLIDPFDSPQQLDATYAAGEYEMLLQTAHNGALKLRLPLTAPAFPGPLQISNWDEASAIDPGASFALKWAAPPGASAEDFCQVLVQKNGDVVFRSADHPGALGALDGRASSVTLPAGLLGSGETAEVILMYLKAVALDPYSYPQALGMIASGSETRATIRAKGGNQPPPRLSDLRLNGSFLEFTIPTVEGRQYIFQGASDFQTWSNLLITNVPSSSFLFRIPANQQSLGVRVLAN